MLSAVDNLDPQISASSVLISQASSDEPETTPGSDNTLNDIVISPDGRSVQLRAERQVGGNGRVYVITVTVTDRAGNIGTATYQVYVPANQGNNQQVVNDGPVYIVNRP